MPLSKTQNDFRENTQDHTALDRFYSLFYPIVDRSQFEISLSTQGDIIRIHIKEPLPERNEGMTIACFYGLYRDRMLNAIVKSGEEIQKFQISCATRTFNAFDARKLIEALVNRDRCYAQRN